MPAIHPTLACNLNSHLLQASLPLLEAEAVEAIEWSFDTLYQQKQVPDWFNELLQAFGNAGRLVGHGVFFSLFSGRWSVAQEKWLADLAIMSARYHFDHVTEHFGFMTGADFHQGAPLSVPLTPTTLAIGQDRLKRLQDAASCPVGLENLAFAYSVEDVKRQGEFLNQLIEPVNGFLILDGHNLYCQSQNFNLSNEELLNLYPLQRVREVHISGGSWVASGSTPGRTIRRDTHDDAVPDAVFTWLTKAISRCPNLRYVVLEQLGSGLMTEEAQQQFRADFERMSAIIRAANQPAVTGNSYPFLPVAPLSLAVTPVEDYELNQQQRELTTILETATGYQQAQDRLAASCLANSAWQIESWDPAMLETAVVIAQKWRNGFIGG